MSIQDLIQGLLRLVPREVPTEERRETLRLYCEVEVLLWVEGMIHKAKVLDVHLTGLCLDAVEPLKAGQKVSLARDDFGHPWEGRVLWCRPRTKAKGYLIGVGYPSDPEMLRNSWLQPALLSIGFQSELLEEKRRLLRVPCKAMECSLVGLNGEAYPSAHLRNLSLGGAQLECREPLDERLPLHFETEAKKGFPKLKCLAKVVYCREDKGFWLCGVRFKEREEADIRKVMASLLTSR